MRLEALRMMRILRAFRPRLIGSTLTGHVRHGSDIDLHVFSDSLEAVDRSRSRPKGMSFDVERKQVRKHGEERIFTHIHVQDRFPFELTIYAADMAHFRLQQLDHRQGDRAGQHRRAGAVSGRRVSGHRARRGRDRGREQGRSVSDLPDAALAAGARQAKPEYHPEGDALYHSLQVFDLARDELPYDEEFLLAALLHDVGKAIDPHDHVAAGLEALEGYITPRTAWLIEHHMEAHALADGTLGGSAPGGGWKRTKASKIWCC